MSFLINPYTFAAAPAPSQLINEQFEAPGATGWTTSGTNWSDQYATAPAPIVGAKSCQIFSTNIARVNAFKDFAATANCYVRFRFYFVSNPGANQAFLTLRSSTSAVMATIQLAAGSGNFRAITGTGSATPAPTPPTALTFYYGWLEFEKGAPATVRAGWSITGARPAWPPSGTVSPAGTSLAVQTTGTANSDVTRILFGSLTVNTNFNIVIDDVQAQTTPFA